MYMYIQELAAEWELAFGATPPSTPPPETAMPAIAELSREVTATATVKSDLADANATPEQGGDVDGAVEGGESRQEGLGDLQAPADGSAAPSDAQNEDENEEPDEGEPQNENPE